MHVWHNCATALLILCSSAAMAAEGRIATAVDLTSAELPEARERINELQISDDPSATSALLQGLEHDNPAIVARTLEALAHHEERVAPHLPAIREMGQRPEPAIQTAYLELTAYTKDEQSIGSLIGLLDSEQPVVQRHARQTLTSIANGNDLGRSPEAWMKWHDAWQQIENRQLRDLDERLRSGKPEDLVSDIHQILRFQDHRGMVAKTLYEVLQRPGLPDDVIRLAATGLKNVDGVLADHLYEEAVSQSLVVPAYRPPEPVPVTTGTVTTTAPPPPATTKPPEGMTWGTIFFLAALGIGLVGLIGFPIYRQYHEAHRELSERTRRCRRNQRRIEMNF